MRHIKVRIIVQEFDGHPCTERREVSLNLNVGEYDTCKSITDQLTSSLNKKTADGSLWTKDAKQFSKFAVR